MPDAPLTDAVAALRALPAEQLARRRAAVRVLVPTGLGLNCEAETAAELDRDGADKLLRLVDFLEDLDDVQEVYTNADIAPEIMEALDG